MSAWPSSPAGAAYRTSGPVPALFHEDPLFLELCAAFDELLGPFVTALDCFTAYLDPWLAPADFLGWLGALVGAELAERGQPGLSGKHAGLAVAGWERGPGRHGGPSRERAPAQDGEPVQAGGAGQDGGLGRDGGAGGSSRPGSESGPDRDAGPGRDGGADRDAGPGRDGGPDRDAGPGRDGGPDQDGGAGRDAGPDQDAGPGRDGGPGRGIEPDGGSRPGSESGPGWDGGPGRDGGPGEPFEEQWERRAAIAGATRAYRARGTAEGLRVAAALAAGVPVNQVTVAECGAVVWSDTPGAAVVPAFDPVVQIKVPVPSGSGTEATATLVRAAVQRSLPVFSRLRVDVEES